MAATAGLAGAEQSQEGAQGLRRPDPFWSHGFGGQAVERRPGHGLVELRRGGRRPQGQRGVGGDGCVRHQRHLAVAEHQAGLEGMVAAAGSPGRTGQPRFQAAPAVVVDPGQRPAGVGEGGHQGVGVGVAEGGGDGVLVLEQQGVRRPAGGALQLDPGGHDGVGRPAESRVVEHAGQDGHHPSERTQQAQVPLAAPGLLEVRFEQEGQVAEAVVAGPGGLVDGRKPAPGPGRPLLEDPAEDGVGQIGVAGDPPGVEQPEGHLDVGVHGGADLLGGPHAVVQVQPGVPDRIPDGVGHGLIRPLRSWTSSRSRSLPGASSPQP